jgi:hypothetical protein
MTLRCSLNSFLQQIIDPFGNKDIPLANLRGP